MRSRTLREGSVGLLIILGAIATGSLILWLLGSGFGQRKYDLIVTFKDAKGINTGAPVRYRGYEVGKITKISPGITGVDVTLEIQQVNLSLPKDVEVVASRSGLIGESVIDIIPTGNVSEPPKDVSPLSNCDSQIILCDQAKLEGVGGATMDDLIVNMLDLSKIYSDPKFFDNINYAAKNAGSAAEQIAVLSKELTLLSQDVRREFKGFSTISTSLNQSLDITTEQVVKTSNRYGKTADEMSQLVANLNTLVTQNRGNLATTLDNMSETSQQLKGLMNSLSSTVSRVNSKLDTTQTETILENLETLTANAAEASKNLKDVSVQLNDPTNLVVLQQTLDAARSTFINTQKITADLDELTGDPQFRANLLKLVNGLSTLVSSSEELDKQLQIAQQLNTAQLNLAQDVQLPNMNPPLVVKSVHKSK